MMYSYNLCGVTYADVSGGGEYLPAGNAVKKITHTISENDYNFMKDDWSEKNFSGFFVF